MVAVTCVVVFCSYLVAEKIVMVLLVVMVAYWSGLPVGVSYFSCWFLVVSWLVVVFCLLLLSSVLVVVTVFFLFGLLLYGCWMLLVFCLD